LVESWPWVEKRPGNIERPWVTGHHGPGCPLQDYPFPNMSKCVIRYSLKNPAEGPRVFATSRGECPSPDAVCG